MNEPLFECTYTDTEEILRESYSYVRGKRDVEIGWALVFAAGMIFLLQIWIRQFFWVAVAGVLLCDGIYKLCLPAINARSVMEQIRRANNGTIPSANIVVSDKITHYYKQDISVMLFVDLRFAYFLKRCIVLVSEETYLTFDRAGFTKGSAEEFETFIREKYPHVKIINKE